ncbi:putative non-specific serine/threonine protein kinase [Helianthus annuus]|nr:putative non-specific serine/threonine protein kinase [Helianthus annuus]
MECCQSKHKSLLSILMMLLLFMVGWIEGGYIEDERKALLSIKASLQESSFFFDPDNLLPTWVDHGSAGGKYCDWERIKCDPSSLYVTELSLGSLFPMEDSSYSNYEMNGPVRMIWPLNFSLFLHFRELRSLDLSMNFIGNTFMSTGLERLSGLKKLEILNLNTNLIETNIIPLLSGLTSLKVLDLGFVHGYQGDSPTHDISEFPSLENLEVLDLNSCGYYGVLRIQGSKSVSAPRKLKILNFRNNQFNESLVRSLSALQSLKTLDLHGNFVSGSFPSQGMFIFKSTMSSY